MFDPENGSTLKGIGDEGLLSGFGHNKYMSSCLDRDGIIYGFPCAATRVIRINPKLNKVELFGDTLAHETQIRKWRSAIMANNDHIYALPCRDPRVVKFNIKTGNAKFLETGLESEGEMYVGGVLSGDIIYAPPAHGRRIMKIDTGDNDKISFIGPDLGNGHKFGGATLGKDGHIYCLPEFFRRVLKINVETEAVETIGNDLGSSMECKYVKPKFGIESCFYLFAPNNRNPNTLVQCSSY